MKKIIFILSVISAQAWSAESKVVCSGQYANTGLLAEELTRLINVGKSEGFTVVSAPSISFTLSKVFGCLTLTKPN
jgi:hypothetical protein